VRSNASAIGLTSSPICEPSPPRVKEISRHSDVRDALFTDESVPFIRMTANAQIVHFDFGNAAKCHRLFELATVWRSLSRQPDGVREDLWMSFLDGYRALRKLPEGFEAYLPLTQLVSEIGFLGGNAATLPLRLGTEAFDGDFMSKGLERIRRLVKSTPITSSCTRTPEC